MNKLNHLIGLIAGSLLLACSISTPIPDSIALVPKSPGTVAEGKQQITGGYGGKLQGSGTSILPQVYATGFLGYEYGLGEDYSIFTGIAHSAAEDDTTTYFDSTLINENWINPASFNHTQVNLGLKKEFVEDGHLSGYTALTYHYLEQASALSGILGMTAGFHNRYLTPYVSVSYEYSKPISNEWFSHNQELAFNGSDTAYVVPQYRMVTTSSQQFSWGLESDFGTIDSGLSLAFEATYGFYALKEENRRIPDGYVIISDGFNLSGENLKDSGIWVVSQFLLKYTF